MDQSDSSLPSLTSGTGRGDSVSTTCLAFGELRTDAPLLADARLGGGTGATVRRFKKSNNVTTSNGKPEFLTLFTATAPLSIPKTSECAVANV